MLNFSIFCLIARHGQFPLPGLRSNEAPEELVMVVSPGFEPGASRLFDKEYPGLFGRGIHRRTHIHIEGVPNNNLI